MQTSLGPSGPVLFFGHPLGLPSLASIGRYFFALAPGSIFQTTGKCPYEPVSVLSETVSVEHWLFKGPLTDVNLTLSGRPCLDHTPLAKPTRPTSAGQVFQSVATGSLSRFYFSPFGPVLVLSHPHTTRRLVGDLLARSFAFLRLCLWGTFFFLKVFCLCFFLA